MGRGVEAKEIVPLKKKSSLRHPRFSETKVATEESKLLGFFFLMQ